MHTETDMLTPCAQTVEQREARSRSELFTAPTWRLAEPPPWSHSSAGRSIAETFSAGLVPGAQRHRGGRRRRAGAAFRVVRAADLWHALPMTNEGTTVECPAPLQTCRSTRHATASGLLRSIAPEPLQTPQLGRRARSSNTRCAEPTVATTSSQDPPRGRGPPRSCWCQVHHRTRPSGCIGPPLPEALGQSSWSGFPPPAALARSVAQRSRIREGRQARAASAFHAQGA